MQTFAPAFAPMAGDKDARRCRLGSACAAAASLDREHGVDRGIAGDMDFAGDLFRAQVGGGASRSARTAGRQRRRSRSDIPPPARAARGSWVLSPASTCATATPAVNAGERRAQRARSVALDDEQVGRTGKSRQQRARDRATWRCGSCFAGDSRAVPRGNRPSPKSAGSRSGCWPVRISDGRSPRPAARARPAPA